MRKGLAIRATIFAIGVLLGGMALYSALLTGPRLATGTRCVVVGDRPDEAYAAMRDKTFGFLADADGYVHDYVIKAGEAVTVLSDAEDSAFNDSRWVRIAHPDPKAGWKVPAVRRRNLAPIR